MIWILSHSPVSSQAILSFAFTRSLEYEDLCLLSLLENSNHYCSEYCLCPYSLFFPAEISIKHTLGIFNVSLTSPINLCLLKLCSGLLPLGLPLINFVNFCSWWFVYWCALWFGIVNLCMVRFLLLQSFVAIMKWVCVLLETFSICVCLWQLPQKCHRVGSLLVLIYWLWCP